MEIADPNTDVNFLIARDGFCKNFLIFNKICSTLYLLISIVIELESIINPRNSEIFRNGFKFEISKWFRNFFACTMNPEI